MKFFIKDFFSKCDQIRRKLRSWSHLLKKCLMENSFLCSENARVRVIALKTDKSELRQRDEVFDLYASQTEGYSNRSRSLYEVGLLIAIALRIAMIAYLGWLCIATCLSPIVLFCACVPYFV